MSCFQQSRHIGNKTPPVPDNGLLNHERNKSWVELRGSSPPGGATFLKLGVRISPGAPYFGGLLELVDSSALEADALIGVGVRDPHPPPLQIAEVRWTDVHLTFCCFKFFIKLKSRSTGHA